MYQETAWDHRVDIDGRHRRQRRHLRCVVIVVIVVMRRHVSLCRRTSSAPCRYVVTGLAEIQFIISKSATRFCPAGGWHTLFPIHFHNKKIMDKYLC